MATLRISSPNAHVRCWEKLNIITENIQSSLTRLPEKGRHEFKNEEEAYLYMWEASHKGGYAYKEHAAYVLKNGKVILLPVDKNTSIGSYTFELIFLKKSKDDTYTYIDRREVVGYTHTHPGSTAMSVSGEDKKFMNRWPNMTFKTIANGGIIYRVNQNGDFKEIGKIKK